MALAPVPQRSPLVDLSTGLIKEPPWVSWLNQLTAAVTAASTPNLTAGRYRVSWYLRVTTAASSSSSVAVTVSWTDGGVACSFTGASVTGNTTATTQPDTSLFLQVDEGTAITYTTAYSSTGATSMAYQLSIMVEVLP